MSCSVVQGALRKVFQALLGDGVGSMKEWKKGMKATRTKANLYTPKLFVKATSPIRELERR